MRNNVETRRCGCGLILGLREGCQRCADAARAKLHARGVALYDGDDATPLESVPILPGLGTFSNTVPSHDPLDMLRRTQAYWDRILDESGMYQHWWRGSTSELRWVDGSLRYNRWESSAATEYTLNTGYWNRAADAEY